MHTFRSGGAGALLLAVQACVHAQTAPDPIQQVLVSAGADARQAQSTTTSIIVNRDEILRHGDGTLSDVLKRQPGITVDASPGKAAAIRMRGMGGGYVGLLLNGLPAPAGFALESLSPDVIERIEIRRTATAETSSQAMAGTINVILRRAGPARGGAATEIKAGSAVVDGYLAPQLVAEHSGRAGALAYTLVATLRHDENPVTAVTTEAGSNPGLLRRIVWSDHQTEEVAELAPRLSWQPDARDTVTTQGYLRKRRLDNTKREAESTEAGSPTAFPHAVQRFAADPLHVYADVAWTRRLDGGARVTAKLSGYYTTRDADFVYRGMDLRDDLRETHRVASGPTEREWTFNGSWRRPMWRGHLLAAGWELGRKRRSEYRRERQTDADDAVLLSSDEDYRASVARGAFFVQDEWDIDEEWSAYVGLRREDLRTTGEGNAHAPVDVHAGTSSPILQTLFKPAGRDGDTGPRDQFRFAVSRTYKAPDIIRLMPRRYTVDNDNSATNPDQQGNPNLKPELAFAVDLAWERTFGKNSMVSVGAFHKRIRDVTLYRTYQAGGVWTAMPDNLGGATVRGIEFEGKATRGSLAAHVNAARNWSHLDSVPGPDSRIEGQPAYSGNVGLDYGTGRVDLGGTYGYRGRVTGRTSAVLSSADGIKHQLDLYAVWKPSAGSRLRLSVTDLLHQDYIARVAYDGASALTRTTAYRVRTTWRLVWEQAL